MATRDAGARSGISRILGAIGRLVLVGIFTGVETAVLVVWLAFVGTAPLVSTASAIGLGVLAAGLFFEHFLTDLSVNGNLSFPVGTGTLFSVSETALWAVWLLVAERLAGIEGFLIAGGVLAVLLVPQHTIEDNVLRGRGPFSDLVNLGTVGFSVVEAAGATVWLAFVRRPGLVEPILLEYGLAGLDPAVAGIGVLAIALFVEHNLGVRFSRRA